MRYLACAAILIFRAGTAQAQQTEPQKPLPPAESPPPDSSEQGRKPPSFYFEMTVSPEVTDDSTLPNRTDSTSVAWTARYEQEVVPGFKLKLSLGPSATVDSDHDSSASSRLVGSVGLEMVDPVAFGFAPIFRYQGALLYTDFFQNFNGLEHTIDFTLRRTFKFSRVATAENPKPLTSSFRIDANVRRFALSRSPNDYWSVRLLSRLVVPVFHDAIDLRLSLNGERRHYDGVNAAIGAPRRDWRFDAGVGIDLSRPINRRLNAAWRGEPKDWISEFFVGGSWVNIRSNVDLEDRSNFRFTPTVTLSIPLQ